MKERIEHTQDNNQQRQNLHVETTINNSLEPMKEIVKNHAVIHHPFLESFRSGNLTKTDVVTWFKQQFYFSISLPSAFAALYARIPDRLFEKKRKLVELINIEAWGTDNEKAHSNYFVELSQFFKIDLHKLTDNPPKEYTQDYINTRLDFCLNPQRPVTQGIAVIALANEHLNEYIFEAYRSGINKIVGLEKCPTGYFDAHISDEENDFRVFQSLFDATAKNAKDLQNAQDGVVTLLNKRVIFYNHLSDDLGII